MNAHFSNVDLDIRSSARLDPLVAAMGKRVLVLHSGPAKSRHHLLILETARAFNNPDSTIHAFCTIVESLPPAARRIWNAAHKDFNVGYELRPSEFSSQFSLRTDTLARIARLGATLTVTYYRGETDDV